MAGGVRGIVVVALTRRENWRMHASSEAAAINGSKVWCQSELVLPCTRLSTKFFSRQRPPLVLHYDGKARVSNEASNVS